MRAMRVPVFVLAVAAAYILCSAAWVTGESQRWLDAADRVSDAALRGDVSDSEAALDALDTLWQKHQGYLHIVISHTELDEAEALLAQARAAVQQGDMSSLYPVMAELRSQFELLAETQQVSLKNIL